MKKIVNFLCLAAFTTALFVGCSKNESPENLPETSKKKTISFSAKTAETKTYFGEKTTSGYPTVWTENQKVKVCLNLLNSEGKTADANVNPSASGKTASFDATLTDDESGSYKFYAISPAPACIGISSTQSRFNIEFPASQQPTLGSVDEAAHIMAASSETYTTWPEKATLNFAHIAAYGRFMLKNFPETVTIQSIDLTADENIVGRFYFYPETGSYEDNSAGKNLTINASAISAESNASKVFWFGIKPVNLQGENLKVTVHTSGGDYVKNISFPSSGAGNFQAGKVASFNIDMNGITPVADKVYTLVTSYDQLNFASEVIIVAKDYDYAISTTQNANNRGQAAVTKGTNTITNPGDGVQRFTLVAGSVANTVAFKCINGDKADYYINGPSAASKNYLLSDVTSVDASASFNVTLSSGAAILKANNSTDRNYMRYNNSSSLFALYAETSSIVNEVAIYKLEGTGTGAGLVDGGSSSYNFTTVSQLNGLTTSASATFNGKLTDAVVSYVPDANNAVIKDATGSILVYKTGHGLTQGQTLTGEISATTKLFNGTSEITAYTATFTGSGATVAPVTYTLTQLIGNLSTYQNAYAKVESLTINAISGKNLLVKNGSNTYYVFANAGVPSSIEEGDIITVIGTVAHFGDNDQIKVWSDDNFEVTGHVAIPKHIISWSNPENGSFTVEVDGNTITSGAEVAEGKTVTLTASPATGYAFSSWTVSGATVSSNTTVATFVVGTSNVTISASFVASSETTVTFTAGTDTGETSVTKDGITVSMSTMSRTDNYRTYANSDMTISAASGKTIKKVEVTCTGSGTNSYGPGKFNGEGYNYSGTTGTWTGSASTVTLSASAQVRMTQIVVTYE